jgi:hypothetical protein
MFLEEVFRKRLLKAAIEKDLTKSLNKENFS